MIKTKQITKGAMVCAIYGALLFLNQQSALMIESSASWIFAFPVLIYTAMSGVKMGALVTICMGLMTMVFGGFTTWFYSWTSLLIGYFYGLGVFKRFKNMTNFIFCFILSIIANLCIILLWSTLFGIDFYEDFLMISQYIPFISLKVFTYLMIGMLGLLQALCIHLVALMVCMRMHMDIVPLQPLSKVQSPRWVGVCSVVVWISFFFIQNVIKCPTGIVDLAQIVFFVDCALLLYFGVVYFMSLCVKYQKKRWSFLSIFGAFIPGLNLLWILMGELDCLLQLRKE